METIVRRKIKGIGKYIYWRRKKLHLNNTLSVHGLTKKHNIKHKWLQVTLCHLENAARKHSLETLSGTLSRHYGNGLLQPRNAPWTQRNAAWHQGNIFLHRINAPWHQWKTLCVLRKESLAPRKRSVAPMIVCSTQDTLPCTKLMLNCTQETVPDT